MDKLTRRKDMAKLRLRMDGDDSFMSSHQIKKIRTREREIPAWTLNDKEVQKVITRSFPNWRTRRADAQRAGRWIRIIHLYYRMQLSNSQVAKELEMNLNALKMALKGIRRVARGQRFDNRGRLGARPQGRPKRA
jgi:hypothetical protein